MESRERTVEPIAVAGGGTGAWYPLPGHPGEWLWWDGARYTARAFWTGDTWGVLPIAPEGPWPPSYQPDREHKYLTLALKILLGVALLAGCFGALVVAGGSQQVEIPPYDTVLDNESTTVLLTVNALSEAQRSLDVAGVSCPLVEGSVGTRLAECRLSNREGDVLWLEQHPDTPAACSIGRIDRAWTLEFGDHSPLTTSERAALLRRLADANVTLTVNYDCR